MKNAPKRPGGLFRLKRNKEAVWNGHTSDCFFTSDSEEWLLYSFYGTHPTTWILTNRSADRWRVLPVVGSIMQSVVFDDGIAGFRIGPGGAKWIFFGADGRVFEATKDGAACILGAVSTDARWVIGDKKEPLVLEQKNDVGTGLWSKLTNWI